MKRRYFALIWAAILALGFLSAHSIKSARSDIDYSNVAEAEMRFMEWQDNPDTPWRFDKNISDAELSERSDLIIKATAVSSIGKSNCQFTTVEADGKQYKVYEFGELMNASVYVSRNGYTPMSADSEYLLYLQEFNNPYTGEHAYLLTNIYKGKTLC
ncbi:MAG: hypothetical protein LBN97_08985 [Oscillospiraceae bacterium]|nr:hypothetical protein [Oscillospiraceae bacterium]